MSKGKVRVRPTNYPRVPFHSIRCAQLVSSIIVAGILSYFVWQLGHDSFPIPWTYLLVCTSCTSVCQSRGHARHTDSSQLLAVSALTVLSLSVTIVSHCMVGLHPRTNLFANSVLLLLWSVGFALFTWWSSKTITHACDTRIWENSIGVRICMLFKTVFTFVLLGL